MRYDLPPGIRASRFCHLYSRVSSAAQLRGEGLDRQIDATNRWIGEHNLTVLRTYSDRGVSAFRGKNRRVGELATILKAIETGVIRACPQLSQMRAAAR